MMERLRSITGILFCLTLMLGLAMTGPARAELELGTAFTYQGQLVDDGTPVDGACDFRFSLWDADEVGSQVGTTLTLLDVPVADGLFTVQLDFGQEPFDGHARWLEIEARHPAGAGDYETLSPRQPVSPTPYAICSLQAKKLLLPYSDSADSADTAVSISNTGAGHGIEAEASSYTGRAIYGHATNTSDVAANYGGYFEADGKHGHGVMARVEGANAFAVQGYALSEDANAVNYGGLFESKGGKGYGAYVKARGPDSVGVYGVAVLDCPIAVQGVATNDAVVENCGGHFQAAGGLGTGVYAEASGANGKGVHGVASAVGDWVNYGGCFEAFGGAGSAAVYAEAKSDAAGGVLAKAPGDTAIAIKGLAESEADTRNVGGYFEAAGGQGYGVHAKATGATGQGLHGEATGLAGVGVHAQASGNAGTAVYGSASATGDVENVGGEFIACGQRGKGVIGHAPNGSDSCGIYGEAGGGGSGVCGVATTLKGRGVYGRMDAEGGSGVFGESATESSHGIHGKAAGEFAAGVCGEHTAANGAAGRFDGDLVVNDGAHRGNMAPAGDGAPFPRPAYDSGWAALPTGKTTTLMHHVGGKAEDYIVYVIFKDDLGLHHHYYGLCDLFGDVNGADWYALTDTQITLRRASSDIVCDFARVRIWVIK